MPENSLNDDLQLLLFGSQEQLAALHALGCLQSVTPLQRHDDIARALRERGPAVSGLLVDIDALMAWPPATKEAVRRALRGLPMIALTPWELPAQAELIADLDLDSFIPMSRLDEASLRRALLLGNLRRVADDRRQLRESRWRSMLTQAPAYVVEFDLDGRLLWVNKGHTLAGPVEVRGRHWREFVPASEVPVHEEAFAAVTRGETPPPFRTQVNSPAGRLQMVTQVLPIWDDHHATVMGCMLFAQSDEQQGRGHDHFVSAFAAAVGAMLLVDQDGVIIRSNDSADTMFGYEPGELEGQLVEQLLPSAARAAHVHLRRNWLTHSGARNKSTTRTFAGVRKDGEELALIIALRRVQTSNGVEVLCSLQDATERVALEAQLRQAQKMEAIGRLAGGVAHDFNNLLTAITSFSTFARDELPVASPARADLDEVLQAAKRAAALTRQLLSFSRSDVRDPQAVRVNEHIRDLSRMLTRLLGPQVKLELALASRLPPVWLDPSNLEQVIVNLCVNASDAMPDGGDLRIVTRFVRHDSAPQRAQMPSRAAKRGWVEIVVSDTGHGMCAATVARIFEPFFTTKSAERGTGLGLSTCYGIVQQAGGVISAKSVVDEGTSFVVRLPATDAKQRRFAATGSWQAAGHGERVLVVDDERAIREAVARTLTKAGYQVDTAECAEEALRLLDSQGEAPALLLSDVVMPTMSGVALAAAARVKRTVLMTGLAEGSEAFKTAMTQYPILRKPFKPPELLRRVRATLDAAVPQDRQP